MTSETEKCVDVKCCWHEDAVHPRGMIREVCCHCGCERLKVDREVAEIDLDHGPYLPGGIVIEVREAGSVDEVSP